MKPEEIRKLSVDELKAKLSDTREELMKLRFRQVTGQLTDTSRLRILRRDVARLETISKEFTISMADKKDEEEKEEAVKETKTKAKPRAKAKAKAEEVEEGEA
jgi:large subunit ribosomal protein L29